MAPSSLLDLCLMETVDNFEHYMTVYNSGNTSYKIHFEYIQRAFSERLYNNLSPKLKPEYIPFLLNPHLKKLDITSSVFNDAKILIDRLEVIGDTVKHFRTELLSWNGMIHYSWSEDEIVKMFSLMPNVEYIDLVRLSCTNNVLKQISDSCKHLHTLDISDCNDVTNEGLKLFCVGEKSSPNQPSMLNVNLKYLNISGCSAITDNGVAFALNYLPGLELLQYSNLAHVLYAIKKRMDRKLKRNSQKKKPAAMSMPKYNLRFLEINIYECHMISNPHILGVIKACATLCPEVTKILVDGITRSDAIEACIDFPKLKSVSFTCAYFLNYNLQPFLQQRGNSLIELEVSYVEVLTSELTQSCPKLQELHLHACKFTDSTESDTKTLQVLSQLKTLKFGQMDLKNPKNNAHCCSLIASCPNLECLYLKNCNPVTNQIFDSILRSKCHATLRELDFSMTWLTIDNVKKVALACPKLESLNITYCKLSDTECIDLVHILKEGNSNISLVFQHVMLHDLKNMLRTYQNLAIHYINENFIGSYSHYDFDIVNPFFHY